MYADILLSQVSILFLVFIINAPAFSNVDNNAKPVSSSRTPALAKQIVFERSNSTSVSLPSMFDTYKVPFSKSFFDTHASEVLII